MTKMQTLDSTIEKAKSVLAAQNQLEFGRLLASEVDKHEANTADLVRIAKRIGCSVRIVHYAIGVHRLAQRLELSSREVAAIGWTKLAVVAATRGEAPTKEELISFCKGRTVAELRAAISGVPGAVKTVALTLNKRQRATLEAALVRFGARRSGRRLLGKEEALMKIVSRVA